MLVSVGLIEKLQLSNCRKPVFRWKVRDSQILNAAADGINDEVLEVKQEAPQDLTEEQPRFFSIHLRNESSSLDQNASAAEVEDGMKTSQSCDSDMSEEEGSDSQSDTSNEGGLKRKQNDLDAPDTSSSEDESSTKRFKSDSVSVGSSAKSSVEPPSATQHFATSLLCMGTDNIPLHPRDMLMAKEEELRVFMKLYAEEYADYMVRYPALAHSNTGAMRTPSKGDISRAVAHATTKVAAAVAAISKDTRNTPMSLPSLAGSIQEMLLTESPQGVEMLPQIIRAEGKTLPAIATSPVAASAEPEGDPSPKPLLLRKSLARESANSGAMDEEDGYNAPRNLIRALQPPAA